MKKLTIAVLLLALCVPAFAKKDASWVEKKAKVENDPFEQAMVATFPEINYRQMGGEVKEYTGVGVFKAPNIRYSMIAKKKGENTEYSVEVRNPRLNLAGDKAFANYYKALDNSGNTLDFALVKQFKPKEGDITHPYPEESFSISFDQKYMEAHKDSGIVIKVYGETENALFHISPWYVQGVLDTIAKQ